MKSIIIFLLTLTSLPFFGQDTINQINEKGQKVGYWVTYDDSGKIIKEEYCWAYSKNITNELSKAERFTRGLSPTEEVFKEFEYCNNTIIYEYNKDGSLYRVYKKGLNNQDGYFYGPNQEIQIQNTEYHFTNRVDSILSFDIELTNTTNQSIFLYVEEFKDKSEVELKPKENKKISVSLKTFPNDTLQVLTLKNEQISLKFKFYTFGYHITTEDMEKGEEMELGDNAIYYRTVNEALLHLYSANKKKELATFSLSLHKTPLDLSSYKKGMYWLCIEDYSTNKKTYCKIRIK